MFRVDMFVMGSRSPVAGRVELIARMISALAAKIFDTGSSISLLVGVNLLSLLPAADRFTPFIYSCSLS